MYDNVRTIINLTYVAVTLTNCQRNIS